MSKKWRILLLDTKRSDPNYYICLAIEEALKQHPDVDFVINADYGSAIHRAVESRCNLFIAYGGEEIDPIICRRLAAICTRSLVWFTEDPYENSVNLKNAAIFDLVYTNDEGSVDSYGKKGRHLPLAASPSLHWHEVLADDQDYYYDLLFVGTAWPNRVSFIKKIEDQLQGYKYKIALPGNPHLPAVNLEAAPFSYNWRTPNTELARFSNRSRISLMMEREFSASGNIDKAQTPGPRLFETAMAGGFQLVDQSSPSISKYFAADQEFVAYSTHEDCLEKIRFYLANPDLRIKIARQAQQKALALHTYRSRIDILLRDAALLSPQASQVMAAGKEIPVKPTIMFVIHNVEGIKPYGGVEIYAGIILDQLKDEFNFIFFVPDSAAQSSTTYSVLDDNYNELEKISFTEEIGDSRFTCPHREKEFGRLLIKYQVALVHFHHFYRQILSLPFIAKALGVPTILSIHDYFLICHAFNLLDYRKRFCDVLNIPPVSCEICLNASNNHGSQYLRRGFISKMLNSVSMIHANSKTTTEMISGIYPDIAQNNKIEIAGIPLRDHQLPARRERKDKTLQVGIIGNFTHMKGADDVIHVINQLRHEDIHFHVLGQIVQPYKSIFEKLQLAHLTVHGSYQVDYLQEQLAGLDLSLHLAVWPETFCITISEAWQQGVVPIVTDIGALGERVSHNHNGLKVPVNSPGHVAHEILKIISDRSILEKLRANINQDLWVKAAQHGSWMAGNYHRLLKQYAPIEPDPGTHGFLTLLDCGISLTINDWRANADMMFKEMTQGQIRIPGNIPLYRVVLNYYRTFGLKMLIRRIIFELRKRLTV
ncbi:MAG: glycosyltransferase [Proteobacteria bacterium]|nr:glycosyltransferase [Pseudomonadota bacterium]MBU1715143.1 glycosyltransferase [Pseudomonadota bacterium]